MTQTTDKKPKECAYEPCSVVIKFVLREQPGTVVGFGKSPLEAFSDAARQLP